MNTMEKAALLLEEFAQSRAITDLGFDENDNCILVDEHEKITHLQIDTENNRLLCFATVGALPAPDQCSPEVLYELLTANFCWAASCGATVAIEAQSGHAVLQHALPLEQADATAFSEFIDAFIHLTQYWEERLTAMLAADNDESSPLSNHDDEEELMNTNILRV